MKWDFRTSMCDHGGLPAFGTRQNGFVGLARTALWQISFLNILLVASSLAQARTIPPDKESLENSEGAGMVSCADLNGYPGPEHILDMQEKLNLSEEQCKDVQSIVEGLKESARAKGDAIITKEVELEELFRLGKATESDAKRLSRTIGTLRGELRAIHLTAHIQAKQVLTKEQVAIYNSIPDKMRQHKHDR